MPLRPWKKLAEVVLYTNPWWTYKRDTCQLPACTTGEYHYAHTPGSVLIVPLLADGRLVMVPHYRSLGAWESL